MKKNNDIYGADIKNFTVNKLIYDIVTDMKSISKFSYLPKSLNTN